MCFVIQPFHSEHRKYLWNVIPHWNNVPEVSMSGMVKKAAGSQKREDSLSRDGIIQAAIELLDSTGESGLTFRALSERLATGSGAIYWHIANKNDLLTAACDAIVSRTLGSPVADASPEETIRTLALGLFDAMEEHPWAGSALIRSVGQLPMVRILERIGQPIRGFGVPHEAQWATASTLVNYILGVSGQNAANSLIGRRDHLDREKILEAVATSWLELDPDEYPFTRSVAPQLKVHDDRVDFLAGVDLILGGIRALAGPAA